MGKGFWIGAVMGVCLPLAFGAGLRVGGDDAGASVHLLPSSDTGRVQVWHVEHHDDALAVTHVGNVTVGDHKQPLKID